MGLPTSCRALMALVDKPNEALDLPQRDLRQMQLTAAQDLFDERRDQIVVLRQRAKDTGIERIEKLADLVPLLFSHTTYKSYPESVIHDGRWDVLNRWYATLCPVPIDVNVDGIANIDDWVERMWSNGHYVYATSGTTGKCSFLNNTAADRAFVERYWENWTGWPKPIDPATTKMRFYCGFPRKGPQAPMHWYSTHAELFGRPDETFFLGDEPIRVSYLNRVGKIRKAMAEGSASPEDMAVFEAEMGQREIRMKANIRAMVEDILEHRHEPTYLNIWPVMWDFLQIAKEKGIADGDFSNVFLHGAGAKKFREPVTPKEVDVMVEKLLGLENLYPRHTYYGMTEMSTPVPRCEHGRFHMLPWIIMLLLDRNGTTIQQPESGVVEGRFAFLDLSREGRWGGLISADRLQVDFGSKCSCGRPGPTILDDVTRYSDTGEDKIDCAGTFDAYVRGVMDQKTY